MDCTQRISEDIEEEKQQVATLYILGNSYPIFTGINKIGRNIETSNIFLDDQTVSKNHAVIRVFDHNHVILDLGSSNKTTIDSEGILTPYDHYVLKHKALLKFGNVSGQYFYDEIELESQRAASPSTDRPTNPMEKLLEPNSNYILNGDQANEPDRFCTSPILDNSLSNRRSRVSSSKLSNLKFESNNSDKLSDISIHEAETQIIHKNKISDISIHEVETQIPCKKNNKDKLSDFSIHEAETQVACKEMNPPDLTSENINNINDSDQLILSETLHDTSLPIKQHHSASSFFVPETQDFRISTPLDKNPYLSIAESDCDISDVNKSNKICESDLSEIINYQEDSNSSHYEIVSSQCLLRSFTDIPTTIEENKHIDIIKKAAAIQDESDNESTDCEDAETLGKNKVEEISNNQQDDKSETNKINNFKEKLTKEFSADQVQMSNDVSDIYTMCTQKILPETLLAENKKNGEIKQSLVNVENCSLSTVNNINISSACTQMTPSEIVKSVNNFNKNDNNALIDIHNACTQKIPLQFLVKETTNNKKLAGDFNKSDLWDLPTQKISEENKQQLMFKSPKRNILDDDIFNQPTQVIEHDFCDMPTQIISLSESTNISSVNTESNAKQIDDDKIMNDKSDVYVSTKNQQDDATIKIKSFDPDSRMFDKTTIILPRSDGISNSAALIDNIHSNVGKREATEETAALNISCISEIATESNSNFCKNLQQIPHLSSCISSTPMVDSDKKHSSHEDDSNSPKRCSNGTILFNRSISEESLEDPEAELLAENSMKSDAEVFGPVIPLKQIFGDSSENESKDTTLHDDSKESPIIKCNRKKVLSEKTRNLRTRKNSKKIHRLFSDTEDDANDLFQNSSNIQTYYNKKNESKKCDVENLQDQPKVSKENTKKLSRSSKRNSDIMQPIVLNKRSTRSDMKSNTDSFLSENNQVNIMPMNNEIKSDNSTCNKLLKVVLEACDGKDMKNFNHKHKEVNKNQSSPSLNQKSPEKKLKRKRNIVEITSSESSSDLGIQQRKSSRRQTYSTYSHNSISSAKINQSDVTVEIAKSFDIKERKSSKRQASNTDKLNNSHSLSIQKVESLEAQNTKTVLSTAITERKLTRRQLSNNEESQNSASETVIKKKKIDVKSKQISKISPNTRKSGRSEVSYKILITSVTDETLVDHINSLGGVIVDDHNQCSVLIAPRVIRTVKFLCCLGKGIPIVSVDWINQSSKENKFLDPWDFITEDKAGEAKYKFDLKKSLKRAQINPLLKNYTVMGTANILPNLKETKDIVESCGGRFVKTKPRNGFKEPSLIISCEKDKRSWPKEGQNYIPPIVKAEALLIGVLQQKLNISPHLLAV